MFRIAALFCLGLGVLAALSCAAQPATPADYQPRVRTITAFVSIDRHDASAQLAAALEVLRVGRAAYEQAGYEVQTVRIATQPFAQYTRGLDHDAALRLLGELDAAAKAQGFMLNVGPARTPADAALLAEFLAKAASSNGSAIVADARGIDWPMVSAAAAAVKFLQAHSERSQGNFNFAATAMLAPGTPFYPGAWHSGAGRQFAVGLQSAGVVAEVFAATGYDPGAAAEKLLARLTAIAVPVERIALDIARRSGWEYLGIDATPVPMQEESIGAAIESFTGQRLGASGSLTAAAIITTAVRALPTRHTGYDGLMLPVLEDQRIAQRWSEGALTLDTLLAYSSVCATGLDTVPLPGDITEAQLARIIGDMATLAFKWNKPLTARLQPVDGRRAGEMSDFRSPYLTNAKLQPLP